MKRFAAVFLIGLTASSAFPCAPELIEARFWSRHVTVPRGEAFLAGDLGVLEAGYSLPALYVAWRYLSGLGLAPEEREDLRDAFWPRQSASVIGA